jgi:aarF domain-containing kinase
MLLFSPVPAKFTSTPYLTSHRIQRRRRRPKPPRSSITVGSGDDDAFTKYSGYLFQNGALSEAQLLTEYNLPVIAGIYRRKPLLVLRRFTQISYTFGRWFAQRYLDSISDRSDEMFKVYSRSLLN